MMSKQNQVLKYHKYYQVYKKILQCGLIDPFLNLWNNMPNYDFLNKETGEIKEYFMSYKDLDEFKKNNPHLLQQVSAPNIVGGHGDRVDGGFKEVLSKVGDAHPARKFMQDMEVKISKREVCADNQKAYGHTIQKKVKYSYDKSENYITRYSRLGITRP